MRLFERFFENNIQRRQQVVRYKPDLKKKNEALGINGQLVVENLKANYLGEIMKVGLQIIIPENYRMTLRLLEWMPVRFLYGMSMTGVNIATSIWSRIAGIKCVDYFIGEERTSSPKLIESIINQAPKGKEELIPQYQKEYLNH